jgi:putative transposase
VDSR